MDPTFQSQCNAGIYKLNMYALLMDKCMLKIKMRLGKAIAVVMHAFGKIDN